VFKLLNNLSCVLTGLTKYAKYSQSLEQNQKNQEKLDEMPKSRLLVQFLSHEKKSRKESS